MPLLKRVSSRWIGSNHNRIWGLHDDSISAERGTNPKSAITITHPYQTWGDNVPPSWIESRYTDNTKINKTIQLPTPINLFYLLHVVNDEITSMLLCLSILLLMLPWIFSSDENNLSLNFFFWVAAIYALHLRGLMPRLLNSSLVPPLFMIALRCQSCWHKVRGA